MTELPQSFQPISAGASADQVSVHLMSLISPPPASPLPKSWEIPDAIRNRLGREAGPQRAMLEEGHLLVIAHRMPGPDGKLVHAEIKIGDSIVMLSDEYPQMGSASPESVGGTSARDGIRSD